jgi:RNA polymerase sigma-70 factor (ECF subfamily)
MAEEGLAIAADVPGEAPADAFSRFVGEQQDGLVGWLHRLVGDAARAEEVAQEAFVRLYQASGAERLEPALLYRIALNRVRSEERSARRWRAVRALLSAVALAPDPTPQALVARGEAESAVARAVAGLPLELRVPLLLRDLEGWSCEEIGRLLRRPVGTVKSRLHRARERLRPALEAHRPGREP